MGALGCGAGSHLKLQLTSSDSTSDGGSLTIQMQTDETRTIELIAIGATGPVTFSGDKLPAFAALQGPFLTLAPKRSDAGGYALTLMATAGGGSSSATLDVIVALLNTPPTWSTDNPFLASVTTLARVTCLSVSDGLYDRTPSLRVSVSLRRRRRRHRRGRRGRSPGTAVFEAAHLLGDGSGRLSTSHRQRRKLPVSMRVPLPGLTPQDSYDYSVRVSDGFGAVAQVAGSTDGWYHAANMGFDQSPCTTRQCACMGAGSPYCGQSLDCCSGVCLIAIPSKCK